MQRNIRWELAPERGSVADPNKKLGSELWGGCAAAGFRLFKLPLRGFHSGKPPPRVPGCMAWDGGV